MVLGWKLRLLSRVSLRLSIAVPPSHKLDIPEHESNTELSLAFKNQINNFSMFMKETQKLILAKKVVRRTSYFFYNYFILQSIISLISQLNSLLD